MTKNIILFDVHKLFTDIDEIAFGTSFPTKYVETNGSNNACRISIIPLEILVFSDWNPIYTKSPKHTAIYIFLDKTRNSKNKDEKNETVTIAEIIKYNLKLSGTKIGIIGRY